jgi:hypothetical protein
MTRIAHIASDYLPRRGLMERRSSSRLRIVCLAM